MLERQTLEMFGILVTMCLFAFTILYEFIQILKRIYIKTSSGRFDIVFRHGQPLFELNWVQ